MWKKNTIVDDSKRFNMMKESHLNMSLFIHVTFTTTKNHSLISWITYYFNKNILIFFHISGIIMNESRQIKYKFKLLKRHVT